MRSISRWPGVPLAGFAFTVGALWAGSILAQPEGSLVRVDAVRSEPLSQTVPVIGRLVAGQAGTVAARIAGPVEMFRVDVGDRIAAGEVIAVLEADVLRAARAQSEARLLEAEARLGTRRAELGLARLERERLERLKDTGATSRALYDDARQNEAIAHAQVAEASAGVQSARADLDLAELNLGRAEIRAPYSGTITQRITEVGAYVSLGDAVVRMLSDRQLEIEADVPFDRIPGLGIGTEVEFALDDGTHHRARVRALIPEENPRTRTRAFRFVPTFSDTVTPLAAEQSVTVLVPSGPARDVLSVHKDAVTRQGERSVVYVVEDDIARLRPVELGEAVGERFEVVDGLQDGDLVVVRGNERLRPDQPVRINGAPS
jgi:RND family efflux transporter MFP subunit